MQSSWLLWFSLHIAAFRYGGWVVPCLLSALSCLIIVLSCLCNCLGLFFQVWKGRERECASRTLWFCLTFLYVVVAAVCIAARWCSDSPPSYIVERSSWCGHPLLPLYYFLPCCDAEASATIRTIHASGVNIIVSCLVVSSLILSSLVLSSLI